jgi:hypothetical protein
MVYIALADNDINGGLPLCSSFTVEDAVQGQIEAGLYAAAALFDDKQGAANTN